MKIRLGFSVMALLLSWPAACWAGAKASEIVKAAGVEGGLAVHVGCGEGKLTAALRLNGSYVVHGVDTDAAKVAAARRHIRAMGLYGPVSADTFDGLQLPYRDNLVNLLVVTSRFRVPDSELMRVLAPRGVMMIDKGGRWEKRVKPSPPGIDEWTHYLHGPDNNAVAHDTVVGPPRGMQWLGGPRWARNHHRLASISSVVTAAGRLFFIVDEATSANIKVPSKWFLVARDAFSGITLWRKPLRSWAWHLIRFRSGPPQVTRLLVASADRVYAPLGLNAPVSVLDAASGQRLAMYEDTEGAEEMVLVDGILLVMKGEPVAEQAARHPRFKAIYRFPNRKSIVAIETGSGRKLWSWSEAAANPRPETLASDGKRVYVQVGQSVVCLDLLSGKELWRYGRSPAPGRRRRKLTYGTNTLVVADGVVLCKLSGKLVALSADRGQQLWDCRAGGGFHAPLDVFVINGLVWLGDHVSDSVAPPPVNDFSAALDLHTGQVRERNAVAVDLQTAGHHHRCYREKATDRYIITGKRGVELMDLVGENHSRNNWVRGTCQYGVLPANGLIYAPPHACGCYMESLLWGFWALGAQGAQELSGAGRPSPEQRLERGPAYGRGGSSIKRASGTGPDDWPTYRHDPLRSGVASTALAETLRPAWTAKIGGRLTQPVAAGNRVLVASVDEHTVYALDARSGEAVWRYVAGGRVDSPPSVYDGKVLFGSADGRLYCLRLADGQLVWRFLAAPTDCRAVAMEQVESVWPVHGSVLVLNGVAYCAAGRSSWLDGGIDLYGLDPCSGKVLYKTHFESRHPKFGQGKDKDRPDYATRVAQNTTDYKTFLQPDHSDSFSMAGGAVCDVLVSDGRNVFLHQVRFNGRLEKQSRLSRHLFSTSSLLDDAENHRSHWVLGTGDFSRIPVAYSWIANHPLRRSPTLAVPAALLMVFDDSGVWGVRRGGDANGRYSLFMKDNRPFDDQEPSRPDFRVLPKDQVDRYVWKVELPMRVRAMLKSGRRLYLGVVPVDIPADDPQAAYEGRRGGGLWVTSAADGGRLAEYKLPAPVVWDGLAAAGGRLYMACQDGSVRCFSSEPAPSPGR